MRKALPVSRLLAIRAPRLGSRIAPLLGGLIGALLIGALLTACDEERPSDAAEPRAEATTATEQTPTDREGAVARVGKDAGAGSEEAATAPRRPGERPIPAFGGRTVAGTRLSIGELLGSRVLLFLFNPEIDQAEPIAEAVGRVSALRGDHNFQVLGVGVGSDSATLSRFVRAQGLDFPVLDDSDGEITRLLRLRAPVALLGIDPDGYMTFGLGSFPRQGDVADTVEAQLRESLRLPEAGSSSEGELLAYPEAPELGVIAMSDGEVLETAKLRGRAAVVIFFLHTCPHCHNALNALESILEAIPDEKRPRLVAVSLQNDPRAVRGALAELGLDYFDPYLDPSGRATERWGITGGVPVILVLDPQGRIVHRSTGWDEKRGAGIVRMKVAAAAGARIPMLLDPQGYSGNDVCGTCHQLEYATWEYTEHATAYDTLVTHAADRRTDCVGCHVVGFEEKGGFDVMRPSAHLEGVGCESCHGRGGPHLSPDFVPAEQGYETVCASCHNPTHSLGFDYATFHPRVSHEGIAAMSNLERAALVEGGGPSRDLLPTRAEYVGSDACQSCHAQEYETWEASPHGHAVATLESQGKADDASCLACHTTAYDKPGGFPSGAPVAAHPDLARVGCESCHGPGGDHVGETDRRTGTILSLGDKCDSCVILKICGTCHDDQNDPDFRFHVEERIEAQRHGTIEPSATRGEPSADRARLHRVFESFAGADGQAADIGLPDTPADSSGPHDGAGAS